MKLNRNSISARLYRWFYITDNMPQSLCPYFWKLLIMWIFILPSSISYPPEKILCSGGEKLDSWGERGLFSILFYLVILVGLSVLFSLSILTNGWFVPGSILHKIQSFGAVSVLCIILISFISLIIYGINRYKEKKRKKQLPYTWDDEGNRIPNPDYTSHEPKPNLIIEFIKARYNKYCPKIDWN